MSAQHADAADTRHRGTRHPSSADAERKSTPAVSTHGAPADISCGNPASAAHSSLVRITRSNPAGSPPNTPGDTARGAPASTACGDLPSIACGDSTDIASGKPAGSAPGSSGRTAHDNHAIERLRPRCVLSIAGSDPSGGAGIQADIKTITAHGLYAQAVPAVLTAQNTVGVAAVHTLPPSCIRAQIEAVLADGEPDSIKIGMLGDAASIRAAAAALAHTHAPIVLDPIMVSSSGTRLLAPDAIEVLVRELMGRATLITPNIPEAEVLAGTSLASAAARERAARALARRLGCSVLIKGGHARGPAADCLAELTGDKVHCSWLEHERIEGPGAHGTGCTLSAAIACGLACGHDLAQSVRDAKAYLTGALMHPLELGRGTPPVNHLWRGIDAAVGTHEAAGG